MTEHDHLSTHALRRELRRQAAEAIEARRSYERLAGAPSAKPLHPIPVDPRDLLRALDETQPL